MERFVLLIRINTMLVPVPHQCNATVGRAHVLRGGPLSEFTADAWSPEHLLMSSLALCLLTTFEVFAARDGIEVLDWNAKLSGTVERSPEGMMFTSIIVSMDLAIAGNVDAVETTMEEAKQHCLVLNSLRVPVVVETTIRALPREERVAS